MPARHERDSEHKIFDETILAPAATVTATGVLGSSSGWGEVDSLKAQAVVASIGGTNPSYTIKLQQSQDGQNWVDISSGAFTAITANGTAEISLTGPFDDFIRAFCTVSGTNPTALVTVEISSRITDYAA